MRQFICLGLDGVDQGPGRLRAAHNLASQLEFLFSHMITTQASVLGV
jgi:hypothetical protein